MNIRVQIHKSFRAVPGLEKQIFAFINKLQENPESNSLRIKRLNNSADPRVRTGRVNDKYRAVLMELNGVDGQLFMLLRVDNHDEAIAYAQTLRISLNSINGEVILDNHGTPRGDHAAGMSQEEIDREIESRAKKRAAEIAAQQIAAAQAQQGEVEGAASDESAEPQPVGAAIQLPRTAPRETLAAAGITSDDLVNTLGLSADTVADVEAADSESTLDTLLSPRPEWERDAILGLLAGMSVEEVIEDLGLDGAAAAGVADASNDEEIISSIERSSYWIDPSEADLRDILEQGNFAQWRTFLHPSQQQAVRGEHSGSARIVGGAGTGKTVVLLHRTRHLYEEAQRKGNKPPAILLTTFTKSLANQLKTNLNILDPTYPEASMPGAPGVWISGIDAAIAKFLRHARPDELAAALQKSLGISSSFVPKPLDSRDSFRLWSDAAQLHGDTLPLEKQHPDFLRDEFTDIILAHSITDLKDYLRITRTGRRTPLGRKERKTIWTITQSFLRRCADQERLPYAALAVVAAEILESRDTPYFDHVLVDEGQDFHAGHWRFIRACVPAGPNDIFLAEDSHQRIYGNQLPLRQFGIETRGRATRRLRLNYRTTAENLTYASAILDGADWLDSYGDDDTLTGYRSVRTGPAPRIVHAATPEEENKAIIDAITRWNSQKTPSTHIGVLCRDNKRVAMRKSQLEADGISTSTVRSGAATIEAPVSVMTMHNAKGMEFTHVILDGITDQAIPRRGGHQPLPDAEREDALQRERALLYVAASRARDELLITTMGKRSPLLPEMAEE